MPTAPQILNWCEGTGYTTHLPTSILGLLYRGIDELSTINTSPYAQSIQLWCYSLCKFTMNTHSISLSLIAHLVIYG